MKNIINYNSNRRQRYKKINKRKKQECILQINELQPASTSCKRILTKGHIVGKPIFDEEQL